MILALILVPMAAGLVAFLLRADRPRRALLVATALAHAALTAAAWFQHAAAPDLPPTPSSWLAFDAPGLLFLGITSLLFLAAALYGVGYLGREHAGRRADLEEGAIFSNAPEAVFIGCLLLFLGTMTLVAASQHLGLLWVAVEATTLASAPLIYFHRHHRSLEATWKYLLICSVGIAVALLGNFVLAVAALGTDPAPAAHGVPLLLADLVREARSLDPDWLEAAFVLLLVGYGTKMGLAPMHTWLPDAHSEAPSMVSALLSGALLNCAFLGVLRAHQVCEAAGLGPFARELLAGFGLLSMAVAAIFILGQTDYKRMLAYSSVEHMGILALGVGLGGGGVFSACLHAVNHSAAKAGLFLVAGNVLSAFRTKSALDVHGLLKVRPASGVLWIAGMLAITGSPPFGLFLSELGILKAALDQHHPLIAAAFLALLALIFVSMSGAVLRMAHGVPVDAWSSTSSRHVVRKGDLLRGPEPWSAVLPPALLIGLVLLLGLFIPTGLGSLLRQAAAAIGGS